MAALWLWTSGCTVLREVPPGEYATKAERKNVKVVTQSGARYDFELARFGPDSLKGLQHHESDSEFEEFDQVALPLEDVKKVEARRVDWYRTGLIGGVGLAAILAAALSRAKNGDSGSTGPCGPRPCPSAPQP